MVYCRASYKLYTCNFEAVHIASVLAIRKFLMPSDERIWN
jgi:hypothetical protein